MNLDIEAIRQSPRQYVDLETVEALADRVMLLEMELAKFSPSPVAWLYENRNVLGNWYLSRTDPGPNFNRRALYEGPMK